MTYSRASARRRRRHGLALLALISLSFGAAAQTKSDDEAATDPVTTPLPPPRQTDERRDQVFGPGPSPFEKSRRAGETTSVFSQRSGERQTANSAPGIESGARIATRVSNRVRARLASRIDRSYAPQANASSPFEAAADRTRRQGQAPRR